jgi:predicted ABC-type sugar transport system permease subunit
VFLTAINMRHLLLAVAPGRDRGLAQLVVLLVRGLDVSVGSMMSLTVVVASFVGDGGGAGALLLGTLACLALGALVGLANRRPDSVRGYQRGHHHHRHAVGAGGRRAGPAPHARRPD